MDFVATTVALEQAVDLGLVESMDDMGTLLGYVYRSALCTHDLGNRRYGSFIFMISVSGLVQAVNTVEQSPCLDCKGTKKQMTFEVCADCDGDGCRNCANQGGFEVTIRCQTCK